MTQKNFSKAPSTSGRLLGALGWIFAAAVCAGLISFLFWQPEIAESMANYQKGVEVGSLPADDPSVLEVPLPAFSPAEEVSSLVRGSDPNTEILNELRTNPTTYTVQSGDSVWGIAEKFGLSVESVLYANFDILQDQSDNLMPGQTLTIPPTNGILHTWRSRDSLSSVASRYGADIDDILLFIGNDLDLASPQVNPGTVVMVPGGNRELVNITFAGVTTDESGNLVSGFSGPGSCSVAGVGIMGNGFFIWPSAVHMITGNNFGPGHNGIDIGAGIGSGLFAADNGTVVYAGWLNGGYGNFVVIDHGNDYSTWYEHLENIYVNCGDNVVQGSVIGTAGSTGNSTGPHLHFEIRYNGLPVNPWKYLP
ncbi:MAG TPA: peptidoglycan DD-metalloendopeptidase family protein [Anaerolineaceae bacterium]|nr:peptidoglycan DD-metalloendopeptidase family protein [Anaerolineaceae bacterium]